MRCTYTPHGAHAYTTHGAHEVVTMRCLYTPHGAHTPLMVSIHIRGVNRRMDINRRRGKGGYEQFLKYKQRNGENRKPNDSLMQDKQKQSLVTLIDLNICNFC